MPALLRLAVPGLRRPGHAVAMLLLATLVTGCGTFRSYREEMDAALQRVVSGDVPGAIKILDKNNKGDDADLLHWMERGELLRLENRFPASIDSLLKADAVVNAWEETARIDPARTAGSVASYLVNDKVRVYEGQDYEKVMVTTRLAMDRLVSGDWDNARVDIKRTTEREAFIGSLRDEQYLEVEEEAKKKGARTNFKELNGYPVENIDSPEVNALRNSYQNALVHYLAGFTYEALGETSLAAPGYRQAIELRPGQGLLEDSLAGLEDRIAAPDDGKCDVLFVVETGLIPGRISKSFSLPIPVGPGGQWILMSVSFPVLPPSAPFQSPTVTVDRDLPLRTAHILDLDTMARRALKDEMPGLMLRGFVRVGSRAVMQYQMQREMNKQKSNEGALGAALALLAVQIGGAIVESADERGWRSLPSHVAIARGRLSRGIHSVDIATAAGTARVDVNLAGRHALVAVRAIGGRTFVTPAGSPGVPAATPPDGSKSVRRSDGLVVSVLQFDSLTPVLGRTEQ